MRTITYSLCAAVLACAAAAPLTAQQEDTLAPPRHAVALQVGQGGQIEFWQRLSPGLEAGIGVGGTLSGGRSSADAGATVSHFHAFTVEPALKIYLAPAAPVRPFAYLSAGYQRDHTTNRSDVTATFRSSTVFGSAGVGAEWFPVRRISFGGYGALSANRQVLTQTFDAPPGPPSSDRRTARSFGAFRSGLRVQLYF